MLALESTTSKAILARHDGENVTIFALAATSD